MEGLKMITSNYLINVCFVAWISAQVIKTFLTFLEKKEFVAERLFGAGGMPSAHSALVCSLTIAMARKEGFSSPLFALTLAFAGVVMYDAMGVRRAAGEQAKVINKMITGIFEKKHSYPWDDLFKWDDFFKMTEHKKKRKENDSNLSPHQEPTSDSESQTAEIPDKAKMLNEFLGHTPLEVLGGALLGILIAMIFPLS